jgi:uncharacterized protein (TIGR00369 family)
MENNTPRQGFDLEFMKQITKRSPFAVLLGAEITACRDGYAELELTIRKELTQFHGYAHGAVVGLMADNACAWAAASAVGEVVTAEYKLNFLAPAIGEKLVGKGYVLKASQRQVVCRSDVFAVTGSDEKLVATALATIMPISRNL